MSFAFPLAFLGLAAIPALVAIYWLRSRYKRRKVSSLILWTDQQRTDQGGLVIKRPQTPLLFFLELLAILLLTLGAAGPSVIRADASTPLVVILDDSFSMSAGGDESARKRGEEALLEELQSGQYSSVKMILAGESPQLIGEGLAKEPALLSSLAEWTCYSNVANIEAAVTFGFSVAGDRARGLVISDRSPEQLDDSGRLEWRSFGVRRPNFAFVNATRNDGTDRDRCMLEIANLSDRSASTTLTLEAAPVNSEEFGQIGQSTIDLPANGRDRVTLNLSSVSGPLRATLSSDALGVDNQVVLLPEQQRTVRVEVAISDQYLRELVESALRASGNAALIASNSDLVITDDPDSASSTAESWTARILGGSDGQSYVGPFVADRSHALTEGLSLDGVVWGAGSFQLVGTPVITAGNIPLVSDLRRGNGSHEIRIMFRPDLSTLQQTPGWPVLIWNLVNWRASEMAGFAQSNVQTGSEVILNLDLRVERVALNDSFGRVSNLVTRDRTITVIPKSPGIHSADTGKGVYKVAANALNGEESDLQKLTSGTWGELTTSPGSSATHQSISWLFILLALLTLTLHLFILLGVRPAFRG